MKSPLRYWLRILAGSVTRFPCLSVYAQRNVKMMSKKKTKSVIQSRTSSPEPGSTVRPSPIRYGTTITENRMKKPRAKFFFFQKEDFVLYDVLSDVLTMHTNAAPPGRRQIRLRRDSKLPNSTVHRHRTLDHVVAEGWGSGSVAHDGECEKSSYPLRRPRGFWVDISDE